MLGLIPFIVDRKSSMDNICREWRQCEKTRRRWANPLSIYAPDPLSMEVVSFNASLRESIREQQMAIDKFRVHIENIKKELYS